jgi:hypothetical protein
MGAQVAGNIELRVLFQGNTTEVLKGGDSLRARFVQRLIYDVDALAALTLF